MTTIKNIIFCINTIGQLGFSINIILNIPTSNMPGVKIKIHSNKKLLNDWSDIPACL